MANSAAEDARIRMLIATHLRRIALSDVLTHDDLVRGVDVDGTPMPIANPRRGIFKPSRTRHLLSIKTVYPSPRSRVWYDDQIEVHAQIEAGEGVISYSFQGTNPDAFDNRWLYEAMLERTPIFYFLGVAPGRYTYYFPTFIVEWEPNRLRAGIAFGTATDRVNEAQAPFEAERRYAVRVVSQRLHQARFREAVLSAYGDRCAATGLPEPRLLDAAHIIGDKDEEHGRPVVPNGLPLSKVHHAAFDANLIGIDPDYRIHVSDELLSLHDGPMLEQAIKNISGKQIRLPKRLIDYPDRDRLALRYEQFLAAR